MNREEYLKFHEDFTNRMYNITVAKNNDYAGGENINTDTFKNFRMVEQFGISSTEQGFLTRMIDKLARLSTFVADGKLKVKDESVKDTLMDLANYCILMAGYIESKKYPPKSYDDFSDMPRLEIK